MHTFKPIEFPKDESAHNSVVEWWYFNGNLKDSAGKEYSYMDCLFKVDVKKIKIPLLSQIPLKFSYFSHSLLSDITNKKFYHRLAPFSVISDDSFSKNLLNINYINPEFKAGYTNCVIEKLRKDIYHIKNEDADLVFTSIKKPFLEGNTGFLSLHSKSTYYYSLTNLKTEGVIKIKNKWIKVRGKSWMDHQWANTSDSKIRWDWFCVQLENNMEIICVMHKDKGENDYLAGIHYPNGKQENSREVEITPLNKHWVSPKSKASYPLKWNIKIPKKNIELNLEARIPNQEMLFGEINYWEGPLRVEAKIFGKKVNGLGFMELVGYPSKYNNLKFLRDELSKAASKVFSMAKSKTAAFVGLK